MQFQSINSVAIIGLDVLDVSVEVNIDNRGFPKFEIVGLAAREINESKERIKSAIRNAGFKFPNKKIIVNLAPADLPKKGSLYDVPIAVGILAASGLINRKLDEFIFVGELSLNGNISKIFGSTLIGINSTKNKKVLVLPNCNSNEVSFIRDIRYLGIRNLSELVSLLKANFGPKTYIARADKYLLKKYEVNFEDIKGQSLAKRALTIAVAGRHNICLIGSPGSGKTLLAKALESIMPPLSNSEFLEVARVNSLSNQPLLNDAPYRSPSHPITNKLLIGGNHLFSLGEITLAHKGVLFLDEFAELDTKVINNLRQPLEAKYVKLSFAKHKTNLPCDFMLVVATNACACGNVGDLNRSCSCTPLQLAKYTAKLKNPLMDRVDMFVNIFSIDSKELVEKSNYKTSKQIRNEVCKAVKIQSDRCDKYKMKFKYNADLSPREIEKICIIEESGIKTLKSLSKRFSSRSVHKIIKVAQTIADLENADIIQSEFILEAIQYKNSIN